MDIAMMVWLVERNSRHILVDAGFYGDQFMKQWKPVDYVRPSEAIARLGLKPEDITDVDSERRIGILRGRGLARA